jgi:hypothetical protein
MGGGKPVPSFCENRENWKKQKTENRSVFSKNCSFFLVYRSVFDRFFIQNLNGKR